MRRWIYFTLAALAFGCAPPPDDDAGPSMGGASGSTGSAGTAGTLSTGGAPAVELNPLGRPYCDPPAGKSGNPRTISEAVQLVNELPKPTNVACFLESLARPLGIFASDSPFSAQPALSRKSPRVFVQRGALWISVVIDGAGAELIEFGELVSESPRRSIKGEIHLPISEPIPANAPYEQVRFNDNTSCGFCHAEEARIEGAAFDVFASGALRPRPDTHVSVQALAFERASCDVEIEPLRCELLAALFDRGAVVEAPFPEDMPTFF